LGHEFDGEKYVKASRHQKEWGEKLMGELALKGNERILDLGCGDGALTAHLAELVPKGEVVGIDASEGMLRVAEQKRRDNLRFIHMDINEIAFIDEFDLVFSNAALHWVLDHARLLANVYRSLRPGGTARFNFAADGNCSTFFKVAREAMALEEYCGHFKTFEWPWFMPSVEEYQKLADKSNFAEARAWGENADRYFPDLNALVGWLDQPSLVPFLAYIEGKDKPGFRDFVIKRMAEESSRENGRYFETFRRINFYGRK